MLREVQVRFQRSGAWLQETSERHPGVTFVISSVYAMGGDVHLSLVVVEPDRRVIDAIEDEWRKDPRLRSVEGPFAHPRGAGFQFTYDARHSLYPTLASHDLFAFSFSHVTEGRQYLTFVASPDAAAALVDDLKRRGRLEVRMVRQVQESGQVDRPASLAGSLGALTDTQLQALVVAHDQGYYAWPRRTSAQDVARRLDLTTSSFLNRLRRAEAQVIAHALSDFERADPRRLGAQRRTTTKA